VVSIVLATAKIHILKQFTTICLMTRSISGLCLLLQRYTFWSNSQRKTRLHIKLTNCACYCKDTHFEAIHNQQAIQNLLNSIVLATAKIHILKQFTTWPGCSQRRRNCACYCKDTHFEAIHNTDTLG